MKIKIPVGKIRSGKYLPITKGGITSTADIARTVATIFSRYFKKFLIH